MEAIMFKNTWLLPCLGLLLSFQIALAVRYNEPGCSYDSANQNFPHLDVKNQILDSISAQNTAQLSALLRQYKDIVLKYPWFLKDAVNYAVQNQDSKSIKTIIDEFADPGLFQIFTKEDKPMGIFLFGTMHVLLYEGIPQHIAKRIEQIAKTQDSMFFSEKEDDFYENNPLKKNILFWDPTQQIKIDMDAYRQAMKNFYSTDREDSFYKDEGTAQQAFKDACAQKEEQLKALYKDWTDENIIKILTTELLKNENIEAFIKTTGHDKAQVTLQDT